MVQAVFKGTGGVLYNIHIYIYIYIYKYISRCLSVYVCHLYQCSSQCTGMRQQGDRQDRKKPTDKPNCRPILGATAGQFKGSTYLQDMLLILLLLLLMLMLLLLLLYYCPLRTMRRLQQSHMEERQRTG